MAVPKPVVRAASLNDAAAIANIYAPYVRDTAVSFEVEPPSEKMMADRIGSTIATHPWLVAESDGNVVGYAHAGQHSERPAYRWTTNVTVYVGAEKRRNGTGRALYGVLLETLRRQNFRSAFAEIVLPNAGSVRLHEANGFEMIGVHRDIGFKLGSWRDIGYWSLRLSSGSGPPEELIPFATLRKSMFPTDMSRQGD